MDLKTMLFSVHWPSGPLKDTGIKKIVLLFGNSGKLNEQKTPISFSTRNNCENFMKFNQSRLSGEYEPVEQAVRLEMLFERKQITL